MIGNNDKQCRDKNARGKNKENLDIEISLLNFLLIMHVFKNTVYFKSSFLLDLSFQKMSQ